ncbi:hypothetical protein Vadar_027072 [Vaccinium darrowii]|uniref:Uncharacterized protein n=1 Tax=Vaccinium darrowii TaxID=229202 RepID=A0ACB7ZMN8_9ERIC|nr:hypothetical protein Vadar_027072 [Vaccinium darrowii]
MRGNDGKKFIENFLWRIAVDLWRVAVYSNPSAPSVIEARCEADMEEDDSVARSEVVVDEPLDGEHTLVAEVDGDSDPVLGAT